MRKSCYSLFLFVTGILFTVGASAQIIVSGSVSNSASKEAVPAVSVIIKGTSQGTYTNANGQFSIQVEKLPVTLVFTSVGFETYESEVKDASAKLEIAFTPMSTLGQEVVVAATRTPTRILESPVTIERMSNAILRTLPAPNYYEGIANLKGVDMHTASITFRTVTTRGFVSSGNSRLNQLIDGMDNQAPGLNFSVGDIVGPTELDADNVELLSGASSALYGAGGMNGTLLITSKNPFKYQGLSYNVKMGMMNLGNKSTGVTPYYNWDIRWAKAINDRWAYKLNASLVSATDWSANDNNNVFRTSIASQVIAGNRSNNPNYDGVNVYGDETSNNIFLVANAMQQQFILGVNQASGGAIANIVANLNAQIPNGASQAVRNAVYGAYPAALQPTLAQFDPIYWGLRNGWVPTTTNVSRTGYDEKDLVDYNTYNFKFSGALHYKISSTIEASLSTNMGTGTTVYTGADRYSLRNFKVGQHKLEVRGKNWFVRGYTTQENAGDSYNATILGRYMNETWKPSQSWYPQYVAAYLTYKNSAGGASANEAIAHQIGRATADVGRPLPGTTGFQSLKNGVAKAAIPNGALLLDQSDLWSGEAQLNLSDAAGFSDKIEVIAGVQSKLYVINSQGTIFSDTAGRIKVSETGGYIQLKKSFFDNVLTLTGAGRYDKHTNFDGRFTPRLTAVVKIAKDNNLRFSYQQAYRFPTNQNQFINLEIGGGLLIGGLPQFQTRYGLNTNPGYTAESITAYRASGNPANTSLLVPYTYRSMKPESVTSYEFGYKGIMEKGLLVDAYVYYSVYKNFLGNVALGQAKSGALTDLFNPLPTSTVAVSYPQNSEGDVKAIGWGIGLEYEMGKNYTLYGNVFSDQLNDRPEGFTTFFNAPKYRFNIGLRNPNVYKNVGFNVILKYQGENFYEGTFVTGTLPAFAWLDAQVSYRIPNTKSLLRIGGTNITNSYNRTGFGSPYVGGLYYVSYGYNIF